jgi:hypothetical protein
MNDKTIVVKTRKKAGGRVAGTPNKATKALKDCIAGAFEKGGGQAWLVSQMRENPTAFMALLAKTLPKEITAEINGAMKITSIVREIVDPAND